MQISIREKIVRPIEMLFRRALFVILGLTILTSGYQIFSGRQRTQYFLTTFITKISQSADLEGNLIYLQKEIDQLTTSIHASGIDGGHVLVTINGRPAAESGGKTFGFSTMTVTTASTLPSGNIIGLKIEVDIAQILKKELIWSMGSFIILLFLLSVIKAKVNTSLSMITRPIEDLAALIGRLETTGSAVELSNGNRSDISEIQKLSDNFQKFLTRIKDSDEQISQLQRNKIFGEISRQVAHDIRSPLSALNMAIHTLSEIPEEHRLLIRNAVQRINDIANDLLQKGRQAQNQQMDQINSKISMAILLPAIVDSIVSEKRNQFRDKMNIKVEADLKNSFGAFVMANPTELGRIVSNIVNNSVESYPNDTGEILVTVRGYHDQVLLAVRDSGKGIPEHILARLGEQGISHGKEKSTSGSGLGIYHAKKKIEEWGGEFLIHSREGAGTSVEMKFPRAQCPKWFATKISISIGTNIVALDDDLSIHQIWKGRLESMHAERSQITLCSFTSAVQFKNLKLSNNMIFLMDYELINQGKNGLDLIKELDIASRSILVTSRHDEPNIREICEKYHIKILPKQLAGFVPMEIEVSEQQLHYILIDNDILTHTSWDLNAKNLGHQMRGYQSIEAFMRDLSQLNIITTIYIDLNLGKDEPGQGIKAEDLAQDLHTRGFQNLYLTTENDADVSSTLPFLKGVVSKNPPSN